MDKTKTQLNHYHMPRELHARADAEARKRCKATGKPVTWQDVVRETLDKALPAIT